MSKQEIGRVMTPGEGGTHAPYRVWAVHCPFRKDGAPVVGSFGASARPVVIIEHATWKRLIDEHPSLATAQFDVGEFA